MGVMSCSREGCQQIMCHMTIDGFGYICGYCYDELTTFIKLKGGAVTPALLKEFMETPKGFVFQDGMTVEEQLAQIVHRQE